MPASARPHATSSSSQFFTSSMIRKNLTEQLATGRRSTLAQWRHVLWWEGRRQYNVVVSCVQLVNYIGHGAIEHFGNDYHIRFAWCVICSPKQHVYHHRLPATCTALLRTCQRN